MPNPLWLSMNATAQSLPRLAQAGAMAFLDEHKDTSREVLLDAVTAKAVTVDRGAFQNWLVSFVPGGWDAVVEPLPLVDETEA